MRLSRRNHLVIVGYVAVSVVMIHPPELPPVEFAQESGIEFMGVVRPYCPIDAENLTKHGIYEGDIMGDHEQHAFALDAKEFFLERALHSGICMSQWFVKNQKTGIPNQGPCNQGALLLAR